MGSPGLVLRAVRDGGLEAVVSWDLAAEIVEVLRRPVIRRYGVTEGDIDELLVVLGPLLPDVDVSVDRRDPDDAPVVSSALAGRVGAIVTGDRDLLDDPSLIAWLAERGIAVLTPSEMVAAIGR